MSTMPETTSTVAVQPFDSALDMARAIRDGAITSRQLVDMHIERIERLDKKINAIVLRDFEAARQSAIKADEAVRQWRENPEYELGVFHGVPMTMKESIFTTGFKTTMGDPNFLLPSGANCETARICIEDGGVILLGKSNLCMNALDWESNNPIYGRTGNPYDANRSPGGSSGGAAAALAAGLTPLELGTDLGGSIRVPAAMCGVVGHCATRGIVPNPNAEYGWGCIDRFLARMLDDLLWMARAGPLARTVEDVKAMLELLGGEAATALRRPAQGSSLADYRVAVWRSQEICPAGRDVKAAMEEAVRILVAAGATVEEIEPPMDPLETYNIYFRFLGPLTGTFMSKEQRQNAKKGNARKSYPAEMRSPLWEMDTSGVKGVPKGNQSAYEEAMTIWEDYLSKFDAVICPVFPCAAWPNASDPDSVLPNTNTSARTIIVDDEKRFYGDALFWAHLSVLFGFPATSFPVCFSQDGHLPVGLQAFASKGSDFVLLDVVNKLMEALKAGGNQITPPPGCA